MEIMKIQVERTYFMMRLNDDGGDETDNAAKILISFYFNPQVPLFIGRI
jgi:hypothetical protein